MKCQDSSYFFVLFNKKMKKGAFSSVWTVFILSYVSTNVDKIYPVFPHLSPSVDTHTAAFLSFLWNIYSSHLA